ncbi:MAG TPA: iron-containing alcohol dehydrogenase, partial [Bryobacteraceae bacterium]
CWPSRARARSSPTCIRLTTAGSSGVRFDFATSARILFGAGVVRGIAPAAAVMGRRALVVTGANPERVAPLIASLASEGVECARFCIAAELSIDLVRSGTAHAREERCEIVIAIGGGSAIDAGKAIAALLANPGDPLDYLEVVGRGHPLEHNAAPFIAIPTTAGTGSEVTRNAVLAAPEQRVKASLRSAGMLPRLAVVDPDLTLDLPRALTASTGLDALTQLIEPYVSSRANAMTDMFCVDGMRRAASALPRAWENGGDREARADMSFASLLGGLALANAGLGAVHGFAAPIGGMFPAPHGAVCAAVLPHAMEVNVRALRARGSVARYNEVAQLLTGRAQATGEDGVRWMADLVRRLEIPPLRAYGVRETDIPEIAEKAARASSMRTNPIQLTPEELREIGLRAL